MKIVQRLGRIALVGFACLPWAGPADAAPAPASEAGPTTVMGSKGQTITLGDDSGKRGHMGNRIVPPSHTVRRGDTLWDLCDTYFGNPWQWPRVWSYNPDLLNPHWIYPGDVIRLRRDGILTPVAQNGIAPKPGTSLRPRLVPSGTVFLANRGFLYDSDMEESGEITGSPEDKMLLSTFDRVYMRLNSEQAKTVSPGDSVEIYRTLKSVRNVAGKKVGHVVQILGSIRVTKIDRDSRLAEGMITESRDTIDRGDHIGPLDRRLDVVPPAQNQVELSGTVLTSVSEHELYGANLVVIIDKGENDGLKPGNRLFVVRKGDPWQQGLSANGEYTAGRINLANDSGAPDVNGQAGTQSADYPEEVIAEIRVVRVRKDSATCLVTQSKKELEGGDVWRAKKGY